MFQSLWTYPSNDGYLIHGSLNRAGEDPINERAIFMAHGLGCTSAMAAFPKATQEIIQRGFDVIHINLNGSDSDARPTTQINIETFAADITSVIKHFKGHYDESFAIGHSYGGTGLVLANSSELRAVSLWDAPFGLSEDQSWAQEFATWPDENHFIPAWNKDVTFHRQLLDAEQKYTREKCAKIAAACVFPVQSMLAENFTEATNGVSFDTHSSHAASCRIRYEGQDHFFGKDPEATIDMIAQTIEFFENT